MARRRGPSPDAKQAPAPTRQAGSNPLVDALSGLPDNDRKTVVAHQHPLYTEHREQYRLLLDAFEGSGGFLTGGYLWQYANEQDDEFIHRKEQARYHNYVRELVNIYVRHVFRTPVTRTAESVPDLEAWWQDVDGAGTTIDEFMKRGARLALAAGISGALVDKEPIEATGPSKADEQAKVIASWFAAPSIVDWDLTAGELTAVKLFEALPRTSILEPIPSGEAAQRVLIWTREGWVRLTHDGEVLDFSDEYALGLVPLAIIRPDPSAEHPFLGHALAGNGNVFRALYNRCSEEDEVLRDQAFSLLTVSVPADGNVEEAKQQLGKDIGTTRAVVVKGEVSYVTADMMAPEQIRKNVEFLVKEIYRMAHVRYERDSLAAESADAIRLQHTELNEMLANLAATLQAVEQRMARYWFGWAHPGDRAANDQAFATANISITYPREFFTTDLLQELEKWAQAIAMDLGVEFEHWAKKRVIDHLAPDIPADLKARVYAEIDGQEEQREKALAEAKARLESSVGRFAAGGKTPPPDGEKDDEGQKAA